MRVESRFPGRMQPKIVARARNRVSALVFVTQMTSSTCRSGILTPRCLPVATTNHPDTMKRFRAPFGARCIKVLSVTPGGAADRAGLKFGDLITEFDGKPVTVTSEVLF